MAATNKAGSDPTVDTHYAAQLRPSKLHGKSLAFMVNCLAGVGVSPSCCIVRQSPHGLRACVRWGGFDPRDRPMKSD